MKAAALFNKNLKRLSDPRGEASGGGYKNTMSMF